MRKGNTSTLLLLSILSLNHMSSDYINKARSREQETPSSSSSSSEPDDVIDPDSAIQSLADLSRQNHLLLEGASRLNCVMLFQRWRDCLANGTFKERASLCSAKRNRHEDCMRRQKQILFERGYHRVPGGLGERLKILNEADKQQREEDHANGLFDNE
ncbi:MAG: hypothetical protein DHS80DRAFT_21862 [Piptocephalis tieghemiana]|nr:MAG: hypothetical protein DHS80DRAFT_21862 [Piptocephalis tieghemiana]